ncbi:GNAT family N-acetyltransferase [Paenibacillus frigoriresistens]|uniref:GNAT family N-acetyltransferase n=1 Tax=Paenibacillus alginolyticus TaxID=59839 RepID=UPI00156652C1|nr:GNAT family N-acetyltransferase [Paenibacillus frigoriresistens]NRF92918.1 GNAT family N-acetyltransferase [Paenibacillus frigoriresistens]
MGAGRAAHRLANCRSGQQSRCPRLGGAPWLYVQVAPVRVRAGSDIVSVRNDRPGILSSEAHGITFRTFEHFSLEDEMERVYQVVKQLSGDTPDSQGALDFPFETFAAMVRRMDPRCIFIAMAGKAIGGITCLVPQGNEMYTLFTGVVKEYRGKGIAHALKLLSIRFAQANGVKQLRTNNHSTNAPMLAVNRKKARLRVPAGELDS